jgi:serine/threonine-protein kinase
VSEGPLAGRSIAGWRLLRLLGQGAHGGVYLAEGPAVPGPVALKLVGLDASDGLQKAQSAFLRGAELARRLRHPGIVALHAAGVEGSYGWLAMELVAGGDLSRHTQPAQRLPEQVVVRIGVRVAEALGFAHQQGIVHRDLKPANVLVDWSTDTVKLADLGLARADDAAQTGTGIVLGTPAYMAPEQLAGNAPTAQSDLYALGVMLFQLLSGRLPHDALTMGELLRQVSSAPAPALRTLAPGVNPALAELVDRLLAKAPAQRPADAAEVSSALLGTLPPAAPGLR